MELLKFLIKDDVPAVGLSQMKLKKNPYKYRPLAKPNFNRQIFKPNYSNNFFLL